MRIKPFQALRPPVELADKVASPPYDVVNSAEARVLAEGNPMSFLRVVRPEIGLPEDIDLYDDRVYAQAANTFKTFQEQGYLVRSSQDALYLYRQVMQGREQYGVVACCHVEDYECDVIKKHERTRAPVERDRTRHVATLNANAGPVFLTYRDDPAIDEQVQQVAAEEPLYDFVADDDVRHTVWEIADPGALVDGFAQVPAAYVADGHHRSASAARVARERGAANPSHDGTEEYNWFLTVLFPASQLRVLAYNRCVVDLNGLEEEAFMTAVGERFTVTPDADPEPARAGEISMFVGERWYRLTWPAPEEQDPVADLDVSVLQDRLLDPVLGIKDPRNDTRIQFVGGIRGTTELEKRVTDGRCAVAFSMYPTSADQLMAVADAGLVMPPKSTWFEPKLRSGLLVHVLD